MFETVHSALQTRQMEIVGKGQAKLSARVELRTPAKKVLGVSAKCFVGAVERTEAEVRVSGKVVVRVTYIDELEAINSEERTDAFTEKFTLKNHAMIVSVSANAHIIETITAHQDAGSVDTDNIVDIILLGIMQKEVKYVTDIKGDAECRREKTAVATLSPAFEEKFSVDERIELDKNCEGILGVDANAYLRDISCNDGKVVLKGSVAVQIAAVRSVDGGTISYSQTADFDFNKTITVSGVGIDDIVCGNVTVSAVAVKVENKTKPELVVEADIVFMGNAVLRTEIELVKDAYGFEHTMQFSHTDAEHTSCIPQTNTIIDIEGNTSMPENSPYIAKIMSVSSASLGAVKIVPSENKVTIDGVIAATIIYECEERQTHSHHAQVTFSTVVKMEGMTAAHSIRASAVPVQCNIKARRGKELLVDARLAVGIFGSIQTTVQIVSDVTAGEAKAKDESAIVIYLAGEKETLWDIAKRTSVPCAEIIKQNPSVAEDVRAGERIVVYRQQVINF